MGLEIKEHGDTTQPWTTSRRKFFAQLTASTKVQATKLQPDWLSYHPVTPIASLPHVPEGRLVCVAGLILSPAPQTKKESIGGESVEITTFQLRHNSDVIVVEAWRDAAKKAATLESNAFYYLGAIKKISKTDAKSVKYRFAVYPTHNDRRMPV